ncbi:hypothetical protein WR25_26785 isoform B [Diploscapter pachys]|uniref:Conserved oligomeric Golgi complex subunit 1 n=1 Tax=Diploscapter pachys TaxID=2018661 RepID=A0A2A2KSW3_9BILA|nr:hypothetical protein WR25_26785 isoform A [Diploscapter pachys]PAV76907.1 hypothetical protein WR25_26785 isoform B [Diploscapter pachys]
MKQQGSYPFIYNRDSTSTTNRVEERFEEHRKWKLDCIYSIFERPPTQVPFPMAAQLIPFHLIPQLVISALLYLVGLDFACHLVDECFAEDELVEYTAALLHPLNGLRIAANWEKIDLPEVGPVDVPICISAPIHEALFVLVTRLGHESVAHLLSKNVRKRVAARVGTKFATTVEKSIEHASAVTRTWVQVLFDCRYLNSLLPAQDCLKKLISKVESHIDPFDLTLLEPLLNHNIRLAIQRSQV